MVHSLFSVKKTFALIVILLCGFAVGNAQNTTSGSDFEIANPLQNNPQEYEVLNVEVTGLTTTRESFVKSVSGLEEGVTITHPGEDIPNAIRQLEQTGLFTNIRIVRTGIEGNGINLEIRLEEQPKLDGFEIQGVKRSHRRDLEDRINLLSGFAVTDGSIAQAERTIKRYFEEEGYWFTEIETSTSEADSVRNRVTLYFDIDPGERPEVQEITFKGNENFDDKTLRKQLDAVKKDRWWRIFSKSLFKDEDFEEAKDNLREFYAKNGFIDFRILDDSVSTFNYDNRRWLITKREETGVRVEVEVDEGPQYKVNDITWDGNTVYTDEQLSDVLGMEEGEIFNQSEFREKTQGGTRDGNDIVSMYQNIGYLFFTLEPDFDVVGEDSLDITMNIVENDIATVNEVGFSGNTKTHDDVVRRTLRTVPGQTYSRASIIRDIRELGQLGYFDPEAIEPDLRPDQEDKTVDIEYILDESQSTDNFEFSGGFGGQGIGVILSSRVNFNNFSLGRAVRGEGWNPIPSGDGQTMSLGVQVTGSGYQSYSMNFQEPWLAGRPLSLGVNSSYDLIKYRNSNVRNELFSSSVSLGKRLKWPDDYFSTRTTLSYQLYDVAGGASFLAEGTSSIVSLRQTLERNSTDNPISPSSGSKLELSGEIAPPLPNFSQYYKIKSSYQNHTALTERLTFTNSAEFGYLGYLGSARQSDFQRFVLGGTQMQQRQSFLDDNIEMRGYPGGRNGSISPLVDGELRGGRIYNKFSTELRLEAVSEEQLQLIPYTFFDAGNAYLDAKDFAPNDLKRSAGVGARIYLPILGLVDISYGYRFDGIPGTNVQPGEWEFLFNIGAPF